MCACHFCARISNTTLLLTAISYAHTPHGAKCGSKMSFCTPASRVSAMGQLPGRHGPHTHACHHGRNTHTYVSCSCHGYKNVRINVTTSLFRKTCYKQRAYIRTRPRVRAGACAGCVWQLITRMKLGCAYLYKHIAVIVMLASLCFEKNRQAGCA
jgi:hypothetical protein